MEPLEEQIKRRNCSPP